MTETEKAVQLFQNFNCAQSVLAACGPNYGLSEQLCLNVAAPFGGGMGRRGEVCGAVTAALMILGIRHGQKMAVKPAETPDALVRAQTNTFMEAFKERHGSFLCRELTGCNMLTDAGMDQFKSRDLKHTLCPKLVTSAIELLTEK